MPPAEQTKRRLHSQLQQEMQLQLLLRGEMDRSVLREHALRWRLAALNDAGHAAEALRRFTARRDALEVLLKAQREARGLR
jgi:hypothetical protein